MSDYNRNVRPVVNDSSPVTVKLGLKLTQIIDLVSVTLFTTHHI
ncbi:hypothetical protein B4U80_01165 [Leptotrombidium deliense]|uniref:Neurotransmitter-gated ion-channel ligand-binding domain-containing protein n=1 Tax=Leptotrombidium deliense TaxID=299467 RepID=A0A443RZJ8_9ACAR|nr:hypothetical protein B4U80_01165 [Leptotrombidium deliense]